VHQIIEKAKKEKRSLLETEAKELLKEYGIPVPDFKLIKGEDEIIDLAKEINFPIAMKIVSPDIIHKSDAGGVKIGPKDEKEAKLAYQEIIHNIKNYNKEARMKVSKLTMENPEINEIDLNPIFVFEKGLQVIDARMIL